MSTEVATTDDSVDERIRNLIWKGLGTKSARQIAEETGLTPERVLAIKREMLDGIDVLTIKEQKAKLLVDLKRIAQTAQEDYENIGDERNKAGMLNAATSAMKALFIELNRMEKADDEKVNALNALRVRELLKLIDVTVAATFEEIAEKHGIPEEDMHAIFQAHLVPAAEEMENR